MFRLVILQSTFSYNLLASGGIALPLDFAGNFCSQTLSQPPTINLDTQLRSCHRP